MLVRDQFTITIDNPIAENTCEMLIVNGSSTSPTRYEQDTIPYSFSCNITANQMRDLFRHYFNNYLKASYSVTATYYESPTNLVETGVWTSTARVVYTITTLKSISLPAVQRVNV